MTCLESLFRESQDGTIEYKGVKLFRYDRFLVKDGDVLTCSIESAVHNPKCLQGFSIDITGYAEVNGRVFKKGKGINLCFWDGFIPENLFIKIHSNKGFVLVNNVAEIETTYLMADGQGNPIKKHNKTVSKGMGGAAMYVQEIENGRRYFCSDVSSLEKELPFNDIIFTIQKSSEK